MYTLRQGPESIAHTWKSTIGSTGLNEDTFEPASCRTLKSVCTGIPGPRLVALGRQSDASEGGDLAPRIAPGCVADEGASALPRRHSALKGAGFVQSRRTQSVFCAAPRRHATPREGEMPIAAGVRKKRVGRNRYPGAALWGLNGGWTRRAGRSWFELADSGGLGVTITQQWAGCGPVGHRSNEAEGRPVLWRRPTHRCRGVDVGAAAHEVSEIVGRHGVGARCSMTHMCPS